MSEAAPKGGGGKREGGLGAPTRHPIDWKSEAFYDEVPLFKELERVYDICHGCRRCVSLCQSFPVLFDLIDESKTMEVDGVAKSDYWKGPCLVSTYSRLCGHEAGLCSCRDLVVDR